MTPYNSNYRLNRAVVRMDTRFIDFCNFYYIRSIRLFYQMIILQVFEFICLCHFYKGNLSDSNNTVTPKLPLAIRRYLYFVTYKLVNPFFIIILLYISIINHPGLIYLVFVDFMF